MNRVERQGALAILREAHGLLEDAYPKVIGNGESCHVCRQYGMGTPERHLADCRARNAVANLQELVTVMATVEEITED